eukprot:gene8219-27492_t
MSGTWKHGFGACLDMGFMPFCMKVYCCGPCTMGDVWVAYDIGPWILGCCCGSGICCHYVARAKVAQESGVDDGICAFAAPICAYCILCSYAQIIQEAADAGKITL